MYYNKNSIIKYIIFLNNRKIQFKLCIYLYKKSIVSILFNKMCVKDVEG